MQAVSDVSRLGSNDLYRRGLCLNSWRGQGFGDVRKRQTVCVPQAKSYQSQNSQSHHGLRGGALFWGSLRSKRMSICRAKRSWRSSDDEVDSMDISLSTELRQRADPKYLSKVAQHLNVVWNVASKSVSPVWLNNFDSNLLKNGDNFLRTIQRCCCLLEERDASNFTHSWHEYLRDPRKIYSLEICSSERLAKQAVKAFSCDVLDHP